MRTIVLIIFVLIHSVSYAQNYHNVDEKIKTYPYSYSNLEKLSDAINQDFKTSEEKVRAIYTWIALHINYDVKTYLKGTKPVKYTYSSEQDKLRKEKEIEDKLAKQTLKTRSAVCHGYATLFKTLCEMSGIECELITGMSKITRSDIGKEPYRTDHAWNAVKIKNQWKLIDVTWGAGYLDGQTMKFKKEYTDVFFFTEPEQFFFNHFPDDKKWLLTNKDGKDFAQQPLYFRTYLDANVTIVNPNKGIIKAKKGSTIEFVLKATKNNNVGYIFSNEKTAYAIEPVIKGDYHYYNITVGSGSYLTIFLNQSALVSYKIE